MERAFRRESYFGVRYRLKLQGRDTRPYRRKRHIPAILAASRRGARSTTVRLRSSLDRQTPARPLSAKIVLVEQTMECLAIDAGLARRLRHVAALAPQQFFDICGLELAHPTLLGFLQGELARARA